MRITTLFNAVVLAVSFAASSQTIVIDSLYEAFSAAKEDTSKINILIDISREYDLADTAGLEVVKKAYRLAQEIDSEKIKARSEAALGLFYYEIGLDTGLILLNLAIDRYDSIGLVNKVSDTYWNMSLIFERRNNYDSTIYFLEQSLSIAETAKYNTGIAHANYSLGIIHNTRGKNTLALKHSLLAKEYFEKAGKMMEVSWALNQLGIVYDYMGLYAEALDNYLKAREIAIETKDVQGEILIINNLGVIYDNMDNTEMALKYYQEALEKSGIFEYKEDEATLLNNLSYIHLKKGDTTQAISALWKALKISSETNNLPCFDIYPLEGLSDIYISQNQLDSAGYYLDITLKKATICEDIGILTAVHKNLGLLYEKKGEFNRSLRSLNKSLKLANEAKLSPDIKKSLFSLYNFHKNRGNTGKALELLEKYRLFSDSLQDRKNIEKANQLAAEYEFRKQVEVLKSDRLASEMVLEEEIRSQALERKYIILALILLFFLFLTLGRSYYLIQKQNKKLTWLNEEKNTLMGVVAHDLRNPLNMIKGLMQLIVGVKTNRDNENSEKYLHLIKMSTQKMTDMIDKVLDISAIENMKVNLTLAKEDLTKLLMKTSENFEFLATKKNIKIQNNYDDSIPHFSNVDSNYFDQIIDNLISNGIKFSDSGKKIYVDLKTKDGYQVISVKDEGPGIGEEEQKSLFNRFKTLAAKPTSNEHSTGLGLSIVKKFVTAMDGEIFCESQLGKGATFFLKFKEA